MLACGLAPLVFLAANWLAADWPQWRGPGGAAIAEDAHPPLEWSATENIAWKTPIPGRGHSQPVVWGDRVFLTTDIEGAEAPGATEPKHIMDGGPFHHVRAILPEKRHSLHVLAIDAASGKILWDRESYEGPVFDSRDKKTNYAAPTPVTDGRALYVNFESQGIYAYDFAGKQLWTASFGGIKTGGIGAGTSPLLIDGLVILEFDQDDGTDSFIAALSAKDGKVAWRTPRKSQVAWSTPVFAGGQVIVSSTESTIAYDPANGKELWRGPGVDSNAVPSPVAGDGMVFVSAGVPKKQTYGMKIDVSGDPAPGNHVVWSYTKGGAYVPSPIFYKGLLYIPSDNGMLTSLDAKTGELKYEGKRLSKTGTVTASPVAIDGKILLTNEEGDTFVIQSGTEHRELRVNSIGEPVFASLAIAGESIYLRGQQNLYCIRKK
jgi:outer membrane protein assembly factor BamB